MSDESLRAKPHATNATKQKIAGNMNGLVEHFPIMSITALFQNIQPVCQLGSYLTKSLKKMTKPLKTI